MQLESGARSSLGPKTAVQAVAWALRASRLVLAGQKREIGFCAKDPAPGPPRHQAGCAQRRALIWPWPRARLSIDSGLEQYLEAAEDQPLAVERHWVDVG
jgi:hypothetical protein